VRRRNVPSQAALPGPSVSKPSDARPQRPPRRVEAAHSGAAASVPVVGVQPAERWCSVVRVPVRARQAACAVSKHASLEAPSP